MLHHVQISFPLHLHAGAKRFGFEGVWDKSNGAIESLCGSRKITNGFVRERKVLDNDRVARTQRRCFLKMRGGLFPSALSPLDRCDCEKNAWVVGKTAAGNLKFA